MNKIDFRKNLPYIALFVLIFSVTCFVGYELLKPQTQTSSKNTQSLEQNQKSWNSNSTGKLNNPQNNGSYDEYNQNELPSNNLQEEDILSV